MTRALGPSPIGLGLGREGPAGGGVDAPEGVAWEGVNAQSERVLHESGGECGACIMQDMNGEGRN